MLRIRLVEPGDADAIRDDLQPRSPRVDGHLRPRAADARGPGGLDRRALRRASRARRRRRPRPWSGSHRSRPYRPRPAYTTTVEDSVYVHRDRRGAGVGALLLGELVDLAARPRLPLDHRPHRRRPRRVDHAAHRRAASKRSASRREVGRKFGKWLDVVTDAEDALANVPHARAACAAGRRSSNRGAAAPQQEARKEKSVGRVGFEPT